MGKRKIYTAILIIAVAGILGYLFYFSGNQKRSNWETYVNERYGFRVDYPKNWKKGEAPENNDGRTFIAPEGDIECRAYGFANSLEQTLDEFVKWLQEDPTVNVLSQTETTLVGQEAVQMEWGQGDSGQISTYSLGTEIGYGVVCYVEDPSVIDKYRNVYNQMVDSFSLAGSEDVITGQDSCQNYLSGAVEPFAASESFTDTKYTAVTTTSRDNWDKSLLPKKVVQLEKQGYECLPMPTDFEYGNNTGGVQAQPMVTEVQWDCVLSYSAYEYLEGKDRDTKSDLEKSGYQCKKVACADGTEKESFVWLCSQ